MSLNIQNNVSLKSYNTFGIQAKARAYIALTDAAILPSIPIADYSNFLVLGGGSNVLFTQDFDGLIIHNLLEGITCIEEDDQEVVVRVAAGENWHRFVLWAFDRAYAGIENLSLIPGSVGASPVQNIGAYGVEVKDVISQVDYFDFESKSFKTMSNADCAFAYRDSIFKRELKGKVCITYVYFRLQKNAKVNTSYGAIERTLAVKGISNPSIKDVSDAVIAIRSSKLPDPKVLGNGGSFFKNPIISRELLTRLQVKYPDIVYYEVDDEQVKVPAGWLIDRAGWKGHIKGQAQCHKDQALVLVNLGNATGQEIYDLSDTIAQSIKELYDIDLEREVSIF